MSKDYSKIGYRLEAEDGYVETGYYQKCEEDDDGSWPNCESCGRKADWASIPDDRVAAGYTGLCFCESCIEDSENYGNVHFEK